jgi:hypothetical protein
MHYLLMFPREPNFSREAAEQFLGSRPRPRLNYLPPRQRPPVGAGWLDLQLWWNLVFYRQERPSPQESPIPQL